MQARIIPSSPVPARMGLWLGASAALFDHRCPDAPSRRPTEFFVSAPCVVLVRRGAFRTDSALGSAVADGATAVFRNALSGYHVADIPGAEHQATTLRISPGAARDILTQLDPEGADQPLPAFRVPTAAVPAPARLLHEALLREAHASEPDCVLMEESALTLAAMVIRSGYAPAPKPTKITRRTKECVGAAQAFMASNAQRHITLTDIAGASGCSPWHLARAFAASTGGTLHKHLTTLRLTGALERLLGTTDPLTKVAIESGFGDHSHFTSAFGREFGVTPSHARKVGLRELLDARKLRAPRSDTNGAQGVSPGE